MSPTYPHHLSSIPYTNPPTALQNLDIWLPRPLSDSPPHKSTWIIYIHGGAWRDPLLTSAQLSATLSHLLPSLPNVSTSAFESPSLSKIAGFASLNYRLSPYPAHPTDPSDPADAGRNARHPDHIHDVQAALQYLHSHYQLDEYQWVGVGHSCGATMLLQTVSRIASRSLGGALKGPVGLILMAGIYDLPLLLENHSPPHAPEEVERIYIDILCGAFGEGREEWVRASPVSGKYEKKVWSEGRVVVLAHSAEDELVEEAQGGKMGEVLKRDGWVGKGQGSEGEKREVWVRGLKGGHDFVWDDGKQVAALIEEVIGWLNL